MNIFGVTLIFFLLARLIVVWRIVARAGASPARGDGHKTAHAMSDEIVSISRHRQ